MPSLEDRLNGRERRRLRLGREDGFLSATCANPEKLLAAYTRWCWQLRIPAVWTERRSPRSRYGRVRLDLYTCSQRLTPSGEEELRALSCQAATSPHDGCWDFVPLGRLDRLARTIYRVATRSPNHLPHRALPSLVGQALSPANRASFFVDDQRATA